MSTKIALPKGRLLSPTADLLQQSGWELGGYREKARVYRLKSSAFPDVSARMFHEKDIPIQVAVGNYDLGICGLDWVEELLAKYPSSALVKVRDLGYGAASLYVVMDSRAGITTVAEVRAMPGVLRIVSEYPNLAEAFAVQSRLKRFNIFPVWGAAEVYPPESADVALVSGGVDELARGDLVPVTKVLESRAFLIANKTSWETKDLSVVLDSITDNLGGSRRHREDVAPEVVVGKLLVAAPPEAGLIWLALPDGHQQEPTVNLLNKAGIEVSDYPSASGNRRPAISVDGVRVKVVRPQDMPLQVANGNFDIAITGRDWLREHRYCFPASPVAELLDLKFGRVRMVAVVSRDWAISDISGFRQFSWGRAAPVRVASEYVNVADKYARDRRLGRYRIVPTWGASEAFVPEDADLLIENTQTGQTLKRHNLKIVDTLFESTACLIANTISVSDARKGKKITAITEALRRAVEVS